MTEQAKEFTIQDSVHELKSLFATGRGMLGDELEIKDALAMPNFPLAFKRVVLEMLVDTIEPNLIGTSLLETIRWQNGEVATFHTLGAIGAENLDMAEGQEYPEMSITSGGGKLTANIGKSGIALKITEEMQKMSQWDIIGHSIRKAGQALARHKERKIFDMITNAGVVTHDNVNPAQAQFGRTTGRALDGSGNGSFTSDDMFEMYAATMERGFTPNVILCHPLAWAAFYRDPIMRQVVLNSGGLQGWNNYNVPNDVAPQLTEAWKQVSKLSGDTAYNPSREERQGTQTSTFKLPAHWAGSNIRVVASPHVPFDPTTQTTSIIMLDSNNLGAIVIGEDLTIDEWDDKSADIKKIKLRERYGFVLYNDGAAISVARNVSIAPNEIALPPTATVTNVPAITRK